MLPLERQSQDVPHTVEPEDTQDDGNYKYKVKIFNPQKRSKFVICQLHHHSMQFISVTQIKEALSDELDVEVPDVECDYSIGDYERRHQKKRWLANGEDVALTYQKYKSGMKGEMKEEPISKVSKIALM